LYCQIAAETHKTLRGIIQSVYAGVMFLIVLVAILAAAAVTVTEHTLGTAASMEIAWGIPIHA